jgi:hypothetical protein
VTGPPGGDAVPTRGCRCRCAVPPRGAATSHRHLSQPGDAGGDANGDGDAAPQCARLRLCAHRCVVAHGLECRAVDMRGPNGTWERDGHTWMRSPQAVAAGAARRLAPLEPPKQHGRPVWSTLSGRPSSGAKERAPDRRSASGRNVTLLRHRYRRHGERRRGMSALNHRGARAATVTCARGRSR